MFLRMVGEYEPSVVQDKTGLHRQSLQTNYTWLKRQEIWQIGTVENTSEGEKLNISLHWFTKPRKTQD